VSGAKPNNLKNRLIIKTSAHQQPMMAPDIPSPFKLSITVELNRVLHTHRRGKSTGTGRRRSRCSFRSRFPESFLTALSRRRLGAGEPTGLRVPPDRWPSKVSQLFCWCYPGVWLESAVSDRLLNLTRRTMVVHRMMNYNHPQRLPVGASRTYVNLRPRRLLPVARPR
jgi:hypothetical protein